MSSSSEVGDRPSWTDLAYLYFFRIARTVLVLLKHVSYLLLLVSGALLLLCFGLTVWIAGEPSFDDVRGLWSSTLAHAFLSGGQTVLMSLVVGCLVRTMIDVMKWPKPDLQSVLFPVFDYLFLLRNHVVRGLSIKHPPCSALRKVFLFVYSKKAYERVFAPAIDDIQLEYIEALAAGERWKSRWIRVRGVGTLLSTVVVHSSTSLVVKAVVAFRLIIGG